MKQMRRPISSLTLLFWNIHGQQDADLVADVACSQSADVLILAESQVPTADLLMAMDERTDGTFFAGRGISRRVRLFSRLPESACLPLWDMGGLSAYRLWPPTGNDLLLVAVHLGSKLYLTPQEQAMASTRLRHYIEELESRVSHRRTLVIGDLNMDPFENGMVGSEGLHGVMDQSVAMRGGRVVGGEERAFFYNPMWSRLGDLSPGPPGTYYYGGSGYIEQFWHTFDQVLLRPNLLYAFRPENLHVVTSCGSHSLATEMGRPDHINASDHFPVRIRLEL